MHVLVAFVPAKLHALSDDRTDIHGTVLNGAVIFLPFYIHAPASFWGGYNTIIYSVHNCERWKKVLSVGTNGFRI